MGQRETMFPVHRFFIFPLLLLVGIFISAFTSTAWAVRTVKIDPTSGPYNTTITVTGSGYNSKNEVTIKYGSADSVSHIKPDASGNISTTITANGDTAGNYSIQVFEYDSNDNFVGKSNAVSFKQTTGKKSTHAIAIFDFPRTMFITSVDLEGRRLSPVEKEGICLGENSECFGDAAALTPRGNGDLIVSTGLAFQDDVNKYSAQQFNFHFDNTFTLENALDGPVISGTVMNRNCWYFYGEDSKISLTHLKGDPLGDVQVGGNRYDPDNATAGATKKYLPKIDGRDFVACFGTNEVHAAINENGNDFEIQYKGKDKVVRTVPLPEFVPNGLIIAADITNKYEMTHSPRELLIVRTAVSNGDGYTTQVFTLPVDVSQPQWKVDGDPEPITKAVKDNHIDARKFHSVAIDALGRFAVYTYRSHSSGVVKSQQLDPNTGKKTGKAHVVFRSTNFHPEAGPYGLGLSLLF